MEKQTDLFDNIAIQNFNENEIILLENIEKLDEKYKSVLKLHYLQDLKISEISKILKISECNVKTRLKRGREKLKQMYD